MTDYSLSNDLSFGDKLSLIGQGLAGIGSRNPGSIQANMMQLQDARAQMAERQNARQNSALAAKWITDNRPDLAPMLQSGGDPIQLRNEAFKHQLEQQQQQAEAQRRQNNARFLKTQEARDQYINGLLEWKDAYALDSGQNKPKREMVKAADGRYHYTDDGSLAFPNIEPSSSDNQKYGMNPVYLQGPDGTVSVGQLTSQGQLNPSQMPEGYQVLSPYEKSKQTTQGSEEAKALVEAQQQLYGQKQIADSVNNQIDDLLNDPYLSNVTGPIQGRTPNISGAAHRVQSKIDQLQGGAFLQARQMLKGGGQITDFEGRKAEKAFSRLVQTQYDDDFRKALEDFRDAVNEGLLKLQAQAGALPYTPGQSIGSSPGVTSSGIKFTVEP